MSKGTQKRKLRSAKRATPRTEKKAKGIVVIKGEQYYSDIPPASQASQMFRDMMKAETGIFKGWRKHPTRWPVYHNGVKIYYH